MFLDLKQSFGKIIFAIHNFVKFRKSGRDKRITRTKTLHGKTTKIKIFHKIEPKQIHLQFVQNHWEKIKT